MSWEPENERQMIARDALVWLLVALAVACVAWLTLPQADAAELPLRFTSGRPDILCGSPMQRTLDHDGYAVWCDDVAVFRSGFEG